MMTQFPISITLNLFYFEPLNMDLVLGLAEKGSYRRLESQLSVFQFLSGSVLAPSELISDSGPVFWPGTHPSFVEVEVPQISKMKQ